MTHQVTFSRPRVLPLTVFVFALLQPPAVDGVPWQAQQPNNAVTAGGRSQADSATADARELERQRAMLAAHRDELARQRQDIERLALDRDRIQADTQNQVSLVVGLMEVFISVLALVLAVVAFAGWAEGKRIRQLLKDAEAASTQIQTMRKGLQEAWGTIDDQLDRLRVAESDTVLSARRTVATAADDTVRFEDADMVLVVADHFKVPADPEKTGKHYVEVARYWLASGDYARAVQRLQRAVQITPNNFLPLLQLAKTYAVRAELAYGREPAERLEDLQKALDAAQRARDLQGHGGGWESRHQLAWIYDSLEQWDQAIKLYRESRDLCRSDKGRSQISYNLACSLAKAGKPEEALAELEKVIDAGNNRRKAAEDEDLASLRDEPRFQRLVAG
jgi:tetratricopeptide (TPR) repeat protein